MYVSIFTVILSIVAIVITVWFGCASTKTLKQARAMMLKVDEGVVKINGVVKHLKTIGGIKHPKKPPKTGK